MPSLNKVDVDTIAKKGRKIYEERLKAKLEKDFKGKIVAIEVETGDYFLGDTVSNALEKAEAKYPNKIFHLVRVGYPGVHTVRRGSI